MTSKTQLHCGFGGNRAYRCQVKSFLQDAMIYMQPFLLGSVLVFFSAFIMVETEKKNIL